MHKTEEIISRLVDLVYYGEISSDMSDRLVQEQYLIESIFRRKEISYEKYVLYKSIWIARLDTLIQEKSINIGWKWIVK